MRIAATDGGGPPLVLTRRAQLADRRRLGEVLRDRRARAREAVAVEEARLEQLLHHDGQPAVLVDVGDVVLA